MIDPDSPAFARPVSNLGTDGYVDGARGLTVREHFAALAMQGAIAGWDVAQWSDPEPKVIARYAVEAADALIAALNA